MGARIAYSNLLTASTVTITSSADATGYPATNLGNPARWKKWRSSTTTGDQWVKFDLGANTNFQVLALTDVTLHTSNGTLNAQANATDVWTAPTVNDVLSPLPSPDFTHVLADWLSAVKSLRYIRFYFTNVGASNSYVEIGAAFAGTYFEPTQSIASGVQVVRHDPSVERLAIGGERSAVIRPKYHEITGNFPVQSATDRDNWRTVFDTVGATVPCVFALVPGTQSLTFYGILRPSPTGSGRSVLATFNTTQIANAAALWNVGFNFMEDVA